MCEILNIDVPVVLVFPHWTHNFDQLRSTSKLSLLAHAFTTSNFHFSYANQTVCVCCLLVHACVPTSAAYSTPLMSSSSV